MDDARNGTVADILAAAHRLFLKLGYDGVNLQQVGRDAGVTRQTVYNQFGSKEAVFRAVVERHWTAVRHEAVAAFASLNEADSPERVLDAYARALVRFVTETDQIAFTRLVIGEARRQPWIAATFYEVGKAPLVEAFSGCLARMTEQGVLDCAQPVLAAHQFMGLLQEFIIWPYVMAIDAIADQPATETVIQEAVAMFLARYGRSV